MPEGPEVKIMVDNIKRLALGHTLKKVEIINEGFRKKTKDLDKFTVQKVVQVESKGKFGYIMFENKTAIGMTFGMTGNIRLEPTEQQLQTRGETKEQYMKHCKVKFLVIDQDGKETTFYFHCMRNFAWIWFLNSSELGKKLSTIGPSILDNQIDRKILIARWRKDHKNICEVLMEQKFISGIGNYIKSEILYSTKVHPESKVKNLTDDDLWNLYLAARAIAADAYHDGGASLYTYTGISGDQSPFKLKLQVYNRTVDPGGRSVKKINTPDKRSTHWVPEIQTIGLPLPPKKPIIKIKAKVKEQVNKDHNF